MKVRRSDVICKFCNKKENVPNSRAKTYVYCSKDCMAKDYCKLNANIGDRINKWVIIEDRLIRKYGRMYVKVRCTCEVATEKLLPIHHIEDKQSIGCKECSPPPKSKFVGEISGSLWSGILHHAVNRDINIDVTHSEIWELFLKQNRCCALSGLPLVFDWKRHRRSHTTASLDRIDSKKGYTIDNIQWVHKDINIMKNKFEQKYFLEICKKITENNNEG